MTTNATIEVTNSAWINLHSTLGVATGLALVVQATSNYDNNVSLKNSNAEPTDDEGGIQTNERFSIINCNPDAGESTWARTDEGINLLRVQA